MSSSFDYSGFGTGMYETISALIAESALYGAYVVLVAFTIYRLCTRRNNTLSKPNLMMSASIVVMFLMSTVLWALDIVDILAPIKRVLADTDGTPEERSQDNLLSLNARVVAQSTLFAFEYILGDAVVVWRACALWDFNKKIMAFPLLLLFAATIMSFFVLGCLGVNDWAFVTGEPVVCGHGYLGLFFLSLTTNLVATSLIAYKAWTYRKMLVVASLARTRVSRILVLLVESGLIYLLIWAAKSISAFGTVSGGLGAGHFAATMFNSMGNQIVGLYPTILIVLVQMQRTTLVTTFELGCSTENPNQPRLTTISFAQGPASIGYDSSTGVTDDARTPAALPIREESIMTASRSKVHIGDSFLQTTATFDSIDKV